MNDSIRPGEVWKDTDGNPIQAHGFSVFYNEKDGLYYWYGENKEKTKGGPFNKVWHWGVRCYTSKDLYNWERADHPAPAGRPDVSFASHLLHGSSPYHLL